MDITDSAHHSNEVHQLGDYRQILRESSLAEGLVVELKDDMMSGGMPFGQYDMVGALDTTNDEDELF